MFAYSSNSISILKVTKHHRFHVPEPIVVNMPIMEEITRPIQKRRRALGLRYNWICYPHLRKGLKRFSSLQRERTIPRLFILLPPLIKMLGLIPEKLGAINDMPSKCHVFLIETRWVFFLKL